MMHFPIAWPEQEELGRLVRAAQRQDAGALDQLLERLRPSLVVFFTRRLPSDPAEDLTQAALWRIQNAVPRIDPERAGLYVVTIARNLLRTEYRRRARDSRRAVPLEGAETVAIPPTTRPEYEELVRAIHRASLAKLTPPLQEIVFGLLRGRSPAEIAADLHISPITVRTRLMRVRTVLRRELAAYLPDAS